MRSTLLLAAALTLAVSACASTAPSADGRSGATASAATVMFFVSIFPLILVAISVLGFVSAGNDDLAADIVDQLGLEGTGAEVVENAVACLAEDRLDFQFCSLRRTMPHEIQVRMEVDQRLTLNSA